MTTPAPPYQLAALMTLEDCEKLHEHLNTAYESAVTLDCAEVTRLPGLAAQLLAMAQKSWEQRGFAFALTNVSDACKENLQTLGLAQLLTHKEATS
ncbi:STAS domain-containing protein [Yoonia tamlensis]|uniref:STAS domain-containing protein n=1 Tax=Yoonia tamlensis TaxID=390270 RepID=A0A1I6GNR4_9RHOB|nr:STAS domain-containing protein [Yoonia tamlensis]SFR43872.1 STAS domain-containing protein [Yoonia tamlensis]